MFLKFTAFLAALSFSPLIGAAESHNQLTPEEASGGWKLLFDGTSLKGWSGLGGKEIPKGWSVKDGEIRFTKAEAPGPSADIVTTDTYTSFELVWEWKLSKAGNSGVKYALPDPQKNIGLEYQILDDAGHPDAKVREGRRTAGALYDVIVPAADKKLKPVGEWNQSRLVVKGNQVEHWLNGAKTVSFELGSADLKALIAGSKFKAVAGWGNAVKSPILLQCHGDDVSFRDLKIRRLD